jgi:hypothetical protein
MDAVPPRSSACPGRAGHVPVGPSRCTTWGRGMRDGAGHECPAPGGLIGTCRARQRRARASSTAPPSTTTFCVWLAHSIGGPLREIRQAARLACGTSSTVRSSVDSATRTALDRRALTTRSQRRSTPDGHGSMTHHRAVHSGVSVRRSLGREDIDRHEATLHSGAGSSPPGGQGVVGSNPAVPTKERPAQLAFGVECGECVRGFVTLDFARTSVRFTRRCC